MDIFELNKKYYKAERDCLKQREILVEEYKLLLPEASKKVIDKFVWTNTGSLCNFADFYGLHEKGPMETFITNYYKVNGNLDVFSDIPDYLNVINTAVVEKIIDANQLKDVCDEENRVLIIYNESFWKVLFEQASYPCINDFK